VSEDCAGPASPLAVQDGGRWIWPSRDVWVAFLQYAVLIQLLWILIYGGCSWLTSQHTIRVSLSTPIDSKILIVPWTAAIYLSLGPMLWISPFILRSRDKLENFARALAWLIIISGIGFLLVPADGPPLPYDAAKRHNLLLLFADRINLDHNLFPSLHVGMAVVCASVYATRIRPATAVLLWLWAAAIAASTLLIMQHYAADVVAGALLGIVVANRTLIAANPVVTVELL
jgi:membrane-associated phospholipid phosphatase